MPVSPAFLSSPRLPPFSLTARLAITESISGTGSLRIGGASLSRFYPGSKNIYIPTPSWANHGAVFTDSGLNIQK